MKLVLAHARRWRKWTINYKAIADEDKVIPVRPDEVTHKARNDFLLKPGDILGGNWDRKTKEYSKILKFKSIVQHFEDGVAWKDTDIFRIVYARRFRITKTVLGTSSIDELAERYRRRIDPLYDDMKNRGFVLEVDDDGKVLTDIPHVNIGRDGQIIYGSRGNHRLAIAKILRLERIWCHVRARHAKWQRVRELVRHYGPEDCWNVLDHALAEHPDLQDLLNPSDTSHASPNLVGVTPEADGQTDKAS